MSAAAALWTSDEAARATHGRSARAWRATGVSIDSRSVERGDLFVAIQGPNVDGHDFVADALTKGAAAAVVARHPEGVPEDAALLEVDDTFEALNALGRAGRARASCRVVGVTGSVGKTSTKEALRLALDGQGAVYATAGNLNNQWGVPLCLARMPKTTDYAVIEMGMSAPGELGRLSRLARPDVSIITTIAAAHSEFFSSVAEIADAKAEIFEGMRGGAAVLNRDNAYFAVLAVTAFARGVRRIIGFGAHPEASSRLIEARSDAEGTDVRALIEDQEITYRVGAPGRHWAINSLAVLGAVHALDADVRAAADRLADVRAPRGRGERHTVPIEGGTITVIDDSYNASPASMRAAFETLATVIPGKGGRRIAVLGDMLELGPEGPAMHAGLSGPLSAHGIDLVCTAGPLMAALHDALPETRRGPHAPSADELADAVVALVRPGDVVTVKGSLGSRMTTVVEALLHRADNAPPAAANG